MIYFTLLLYGLYPALNMYYLKELQKKKKNPIHFLFYV